MIRSARHLCVGLLVALLGTGCDDQSSTGLPQQLADCAFGDALSLGVGEASRAPGNRVLCVSAPAGGEFVLVPFAALARDTLFKASIGVEGGGFVDVGGTALTDPITAFTSERLARFAPTEAFHRELRTAEQEELRFTPAAAGDVVDELDVMRRQARRAPSAAPPVVGDLLRLSVAASCGVNDPRQGRVMAVSDHAVVVADVQNPQPTLTTSDFQAFAQEFDALIEPTVTGLFGAPTDLDDNQRIVLFFTRGVNEKTPFGGAGVVAGFFWGGDLFPRTDTGRLQGCPSSNLAEVLYLAVPEPNGEVSGNRLSVDLLREVTPSTMGHELQHLINASRRIHISQADRFEESWMNEGLSFIAEEALFYAASGLAPAMNLDTTQVTGSSRVREAFNRYAVDNLGRYNLYMQAPSTSSPVATDRLTTRGAAWSFLRYAADRDPRPDDAFFRDLANATGAGLDNLEARIGEDPVEWMADWAVSVYADDLVPDLPPELQQPSWNTRELIASLRLDARFPLRLLAVPPGSGFSLTLQPSGAAAYVVFGLESGGRALLRFSTSDESSIRSTLLRVR
ncbi:MAG: hypothetical protein R3E98_14860 [Gemmatimonadota bacterium]|nr:hypothetical protein [Gemmatimonadota bacterium]